jgi:protein tyrosine/serine phosphatase
MTLINSGKEMIGNLFRFVASELSVQDRSAMVVHCTAGKDRTGVFIALLLGLCGVDDEIIVKEYGLSAIGYLEESMCCH